MSIDHNLNPRIIFWGTMDVAVPTLDALIENGYRPIAVVTTPDQPAGRKQMLTPPPVKIFAQKHNIPVFQPESLKDEYFKKDFPEADLYILVAYGKIIPKDILAKPRLGILNGHPSLLPRWRGPSPTQFTILNKDAEAGVTIFLTDELMDHGPVVAQRKINIGDRKFTHPKLHEDLAKIRAELFIETLPQWLAGKITPMPQDDTLATYSKILKKDSGRIDWKKPAEYIERMIRALNPWPSTWTVWPSSQKIARVKILEAETTSEEPLGGGPGYVWQSPTAPLLVKTGKGSLEIKELTLEGRKGLRAEAFLRGHQNIIGNTLI